MRRAGLGHAPSGQRPEESGSPGTPANASRGCRPAWSSLKPQTRHSSLKKRANLIQTASVIQYPTFVDGKTNYNGSPDLRRSPLLGGLVKEYFVPMVNSLPQAQILALGDVPWKTLEWLADQGLIDRQRILICTPHPSPANNERISYFLEKTPPDAKPSDKTDPTKLAQVRHRLLAALQRVR